uniref:Uncharacterized protein n=1 Tax=Lepeophtheirus salmonis TaxID=72036 RepID=A0A0K2THI8_LEPSM
MTLNPTTQQKEDFRRRQFNTF